MKGPEKEDKELTTYIADTLRDHTLPYKEGAWEKYASLAKPGRKLVLWPYLSGAAALLLAGAVFWFNSLNEQKPANNQPTAAVQTIPQAKEVKEVELQAPVLTGTQAQSLTEPETVALTDKASSKAMNKPAIPEIPIENIAVVPSAAITSQPLVPVVPQSTEPSMQQSLITAAVSPEQTAAVTPDPATGADIQQEDRFLRMLQQEEARGRDVHAESGTKESGLMAINNAKKWDIGVVLAPSVTRERFNFGGGVEVAYRLGSRLSLGSGISVTRLGVEQAQQGIYIPREMSFASNSPVTGNSPGNGNSLVADKGLEEKQLESVRTSVVGLDVPLNFSYNISKNFYASAGVSFFAVITEERTNMFVREVPSMQTVKTADGASFQQPVMETQHVSEASADQPLKSSGNNGFINFSLGRRIPLGSRINLGIEPFVKLPIGRAARQDVNLSYGGLKLTTGF